MIKMSKTIQLSWAIDYSDPHFSGNGKSFNQDQARSKIFNSPLFLCRIWSSPFVSKSWTPREGSKTDVKIWPNSANGATHISQCMAGFVQEPSQIRRQRKKLFATHPISHPFQLGDCLVIRLRVPKEWLVVRRDDWLVEMHSECFII